MTHPYHIDPRHSDTKDELSVQVAFRNQMRTQAPAVILAGIPNAGKRSRWEAVQRSKEGLVKGFPDMIAFHEGRVACLEFKSGKGQPSDAQIECLNRLHRQKIPVGIFRKAETAVEWLQGQWPDAFLQP